MIPRSTSDLTPLLMKHTTLRFREKLLYFAQGRWKEPQNFRQMTPEQRREVQNHWREKSSFPTIENEWIWFGYYSHTDFKPLYQRTRVARYLHEALIAKLGDGRLNSVMTNTVCDVNPYKYSAPNAVKGTHVLQSISENTDYNNQETRKNTAREKAFAAMEQDWIDYEYEAICKGNSQEIFDMMAMIGHNLLLLREFLTTKGHKVK